MSAYAELQDWINGTPTGGPNGDGRYPLTDTNGQVYLLLCPAADKAANEDLSTQPEIFALEAGEARDQAVVARDAAAASADVASAAATAAGASELAAKASETAAAGSASTASTKAGEAAASATTASTQASDAAASATAAAGSKTAAATSATNAATSAAEAEAWALTAQSAATGTLRYVGVWDASSGVFPGSPLKGDFWKVNVAGTIGGVVLKVGDHIVYSGTGWDRINNYETVTSVAGKVGAVTLGVGDVGGLDTALAAKAPLANPAFTGGWVAVTTGDAKKNLFINAGDFVSFNYANGYNAGSYQWQFAGVTGMTLTKDSRLGLGGGHSPAGVIDAYTGNGRIVVRTGASGRNNIDSVTYDNSAYAPLNLSGSEVLINGQTAWHAGNFDPAGKANFYGPFGVGDAIGRNPDSIKPNNNGRSVKFDFVNGFGGSRYNAVMTINPWLGDTNSTGDAAYQLSFGGTAPDGAGTPALKIRKGIDSTWGGWYDLWTSANFWPGNYVLNQPGYLVSDANALVGTAASGLAPTAGNTPKGNWATVLQVGFQSGNARSFQLGHSWLEPGYPLYFRANKGDTSSTFTSWRPMRGIFVQAGDPGAAAEEGDLWIW